MKLIQVRNVFVFAVIAAVTFPKEAQAWGHRGHQTIATVASQIVRLKQSLWQANADEMGVLTNVPDVVWKSGPNAQFETPNHWFQIDSYFTGTQDHSLFPHLYPDAVKKYTEKTVIVNGTAPWRIKQFYDLAVSALKKRDFATGLQMAGAMSHYIGDLSQPLHVSENYDGQMTGDPGIHKFFETTNLDATKPADLSSEVTDMAQKLLNDKDFLSEFEGDVADVAFRELERAYADKDELIQTDIKYGRGKAGAAELLKIAKPRLADGAATLAIILERLSKDAGLGEDGASVRVDIPTWIAPQFGSPSPPAKKQFYVSETAKLAQFLDGNSEDDCDQ